MKCVCGHERDDHCGCGKECFAHGPLERQEDGRQEWAWTCDCRGYVEAPTAVFYGRCPGCGTIQPLSEHATFPGFACSHKAP